MRHAIRHSILASIVAGSLLSLGLVSANAATVTYYACVNNSTGTIRIVTQTTTCKTGEHKIQWNQVGPQGPKGTTGPQGPQGPPGTAGSGVYYSGSNLGTLTTTPVSIIQPAPQITQAGSYMFIGNASVMNSAVAGGSTTATCFVQVGTNNLLPSTAAPSGTFFPANLTATGAVTLGTAEVPVTASLMCGSSSEGSGEITVTQASLSIIQVGTLKIGP